ncbi:hypothetical protein FACS1894172_16540 [Spirochaetia bacterium]|nr:hypothetical protein FACS1894164_15180 [Spirochaetia bacterium]GHU35167.1 hypothetical protein FACS1894172_16540 [Spirochaetia bacterium]
MNVQDLQETAALAHLDLTETELQSAFPAFEEMLGFFAVMQVADQDLPAFSGSKPVTSVQFRLDQPERPQDPAPLLDRAGERDGQFIVIPNVL